MTQPRANAIVNSLLRLDRAGDEASKANEKLKAAAVHVAQHIAAKVGPNAELPRGYKVVRTTDALVLYAGSPAGQLWFDADNITTEGARYLAQDVARGFITEVAAYLEARTQEAERAAETLREAKLP